MTITRVTSFEVENLQFSVARDIDSLQQQQSLLKTTSALNGIEVTCSLPRSHGTSKVVIHGVPLGDTDEEIKKELEKKYEISYVRRIT